MVRGNLVSLFRSVVAFVLGIFGTVIADRKITVTLGCCSAGTTPLRIVYGTHLEVSKATAIASGDTSMCWCRQRGVSALPAISPGAVVTSRKHSVTLGKGHDVNRKPD